MGNVFEPVCALETVSALVSAMKAKGALGAAMTGTGTAVAGLFADEAAAQTCLESLRQTLPLEYLGIHRPVAGGAKVVGALP
jgi:4-diphosphocytidyl-2-C-methyl-D-erythritol kinase